MNSSFVLMHRITGAVLSGYVVMAAAEAEIADANRRLAASGQEYRYIAKPVEQTVKAA